MLGGVNSTSHTELPTLDSASIALCTLFQAGFWQLVQDTQSADNLPEISVHFPACSPADNKFQQKDQSDESNSKRETSLSSAPCACSYELDLRLTLLYWITAWSESPPEILTELSSETPPQNPVPGIVTPGTLGS